MQLKVEKVGGKWEVGSRKWGAETRKAGSREQESGNKKQKAQSVRAKCVKHSSVTKTKQFRSMQA